MRSARKGAIALLCLGALLAPASAASGAEAKPAWLLSATGLPTNFPAGAKGTDFGGPAYLLVATNVGAAPSGGPVTITDTLPTGLSAASPSGCEVSGQAVTCVSAGPVEPGESLKFRVPVDVDPLAPVSLQNEASVEGGGALPASASTTTVSSASAPFGFLQGFRVPLSEADGSPATLAGSHPYQFTASMGFPTEKSSVGLGGAGHLRDLSVDLPPGLIVNPTATPVLCTELELTSEGFPGCPDDSQLGIVDVTTITGGPFTKAAPLYNMVPPPGAAASLGLDALGVGVFVHITGGVRSDGDYGITGGVKDTVALTNNPVFGAQLQLWGDPSAESHDEVRGECLTSEAAKDCTAEAQDTALLTLPGDCSGQPSSFLGHALSWEQPNLVEEASYESADLAGTPVSLSGCGQLDFEPTIEAKPTTNLTDSPSGLDFHLRQPTDTRLEGGSPTVVKDATVTLPEGLVVNPSSADGQAACDSAQIGLITPIGQTPIHFSKAPARCPDAAKVGTVEVKTPLLAQIDPNTNKVQRDPEGNAIARPLEGSVYLAKPFDNPFGSLLAIYFSVEDPQSGTVAKFAGRVFADPVTGQLTTRVIEAPQLPLADVRLQLFKGPRASLRTPLSCATHTTSSKLVPWSGSQATQEPTDSFATTAQGRAVSDPLPRILEGIPLDVRSVAIRIERPNFTLNPTSCAEKAFAGAATSALGQIAPLAERFQVGGCKSLPYKPKLTTRLFGPIHRGGHPRFRTIFTAKAGEANTKRIVLALPRSEFIDQGHFRTICTRVQFAANACPPGSIYGHVKATSPLLDYPLEGAVYLRSSSHKLPDAVLALRGPPSQPIAIDVLGRIDSVNGGLRTTIETVPDAPITKAVVTLQGGRKGLFQNSTNICKGTFRATLKLDGQNGKTHDTRPLMRADCNKKKKKGGAKHR